MSTKRNYRVISRGGEAAIPGENVPASACGSDFSESKARLMISAGAPGNVTCRLYEDEAGRFFVRTVQGDAKRVVGVSLNVATKIYERETRSQLRFLIAAKLDVPICVEDDDGKIYDTAKDKLLYKEDFDHEAVSGHETIDGQFYFRFVNADADRIMIPKRRTKEKDALNELLLGELTVENNIENMWTIITLWCSWDRTFLSFIDLACEWSDYLYLDFEVIIIAMDEDEYWTHSFVN
jgi:hypothetical protein